MISKFQLDVVIKDCIPQRIVIREKGGTELHLSVIIVIASNLELAQLVVQGGDLKPHGTPESNMSILAVQKFISMTTNRPK